MVAHVLILHGALGKTLKDATEDVVHWFELLEDTDLANSPSARMFFKNENHLKSNQMQYQNRES